VQTGLADILYELAKYLVNVVDTVSVISSCACHPRGHHLGHYALAILNQDHRCFKAFVVIGTGCSWGSGPKCELHPGLNAFQ
jgi:hypothetical protein